MTDSATHQLLRSTRRSAVHLETRDGYTPDDPDWIDWREGRRFDPAQRWRDWFDLIVSTTTRGVDVRRARIVSEPVTEYIRFEYDVTQAHNVAAGERVRWLSRRAASDLLVPASDCWVFDSEVVVFNHFDGDGNWVGEERRNDPGLAGGVAAAFETVWERAVDHAAYRPA